jgi:hypothetical protein
MFTSKIISEGSVKIGRTGTKRHAAKKILRVYEIGTSHPMAGKSTTDTVVTCSCGCKGRNGGKIVMSYFEGVAGNCGD